MKISCVNEHPKVYLAQKGPAKVFGKNVDKRERLSRTQAIEWFDRIWDASIEPALRGGTRIEVDSVLNKVPESWHTFVDPSTEHREFWVAGCLFIAQLPDAGSCDQIWYISSTSGDPRTLYVKFSSTMEREAFQEFAAKLGWRDDLLALKLIRDLVGNVRGPQLK